MERDRAEGLLMNSTGAGPRRGSSNQSSAFNRTDVTRRPIVGRYRGVVGL